MELVNRTHSAQNHRGFEEGVDPIKAGDEMVPEQTDDQSQRNYRQRDSQGTGDALEIDRSGREIITSTLVFPPVGRLSLRLSLRQ